jgi:AhpD family alkylhydroperoxidase
LSDVYGRQIKVRVKRIYDLPVVNNQLRKEFGVMSEQEQIYQPLTGELAEQRKSLAPKPAEAFKAFSQSVFAEGALSAKTKQLIAVAVAHVTQCPYCIRGHTRAAVRRGATAEEIMEAIWVAAEMRAGAAYAHSVIALDTIARDKAERASDREKFAGVSGADAKDQT